jgi:hypothetical protein
LVDHDALSETAEVLVNNEGLAILSLLKVQSVPLGNLGGAAFMLRKVSIFVFEKLLCINAANV